jgi:hypothetical protein
LLDESLDDLVAGNGSGYAVEVGEAYGALSAGLVLEHKAVSVLDQRAHLRRNIRLCVTPCPTISCMAMGKRANIAYLI